MFWTIVLSALVGALASRAVTWWIGAAEIRRLTRHLDIVRGHGNDARTTAEERRVELVRWKNTLVDIDPKAYREVARRLDDK